MAGSSEIGASISFPYGFVKTAWKSARAARAVPTCPSAARRYLDRLDLGVEDLFHHVLAVLHDPTYREANADALRMDWPRIPLPGWPDGDASEAAETLARSATRGRELAALLDPDTPVPGVTTGTLRPEVAAIAVPATVDGRNIAGDDFALTAGWGHYGTGEAVMPGQGRVVERDYTADERAALGDATGMLGQTTFDIYLNGNALLAQRPRCGLALQTRRLSGAQEVAVVSGTCGCWAERWCWKRMCCILRRWRGGLGR